MTGAVQLVLLACYLGDAAACLTVTGPAVASAAVCEAAAPEFARRWSEINPGWQVADWTCSPVPRDA